MGPSDLETASIDGTGPSGGRFSKNQSYYLLKDLFKYTITRKFEFVQYRKPNKKGKRTFAVAERHYQKTDDGRLFKDKIYVSLHLESSPEPSPLLKKLAENGNLGFKSGRGFQEWSKEKAEKSRKKLQEYLLDVVER